MRRSVVVGMALIGCLAWVGVVSGQEATPVIGPTELPVTPDPADCVVEPRTAGELRALIGTPEPFVPPPDATPIQPTAVPRPTAPSSLPADIEATAGVIATVYHFLACVNAGDVLRGYALYTDEFVRTTVFLDQSVDQPPRPVAVDERVTLLDVVYLREYPDGRIGAVVVIDDPLAPSPAEPYFFVFRQLDGVWLFDEWPATTFLGP